MVINYADMKRKLARTVRYYQVGVLNTIVGYSLYAIFVRLGLNMYVAQFCSHVLGVTFNYLTYSRYAFADRRPSKMRYILSYAGNYLFGLSMLWACAQLIRSPYLAMAVAVIIVTAVNFFVLSRFVFHAPRAA